LMLAYEELKGSSGRQIWFRPPRYQARQLFPHLPPRVRVRSALHKLQDISIGGIGVVCNQSVEDVPDVGEIVPLSLQQSGYPIFESNARVCRREHTVFGSKVAFSFVNGFVEFDKLLSRNAQAQIAVQSALFADETSQLVPKEYRVFCADVLLLLGSYRDLLDQNKVLAEQFGRDFDLEGTYEACEAPMIRHWRSLWRTGNDLVRDIMLDREVLEATKAFTEVVVTPEMRNGAIWDRSYAKPLGYPGDFEVMNQVYDWQHKGTNVYQMLVHRLGLDVAECIKTRMEVVRATIGSVVQEKGVARAARVLSLGSGPAREVELFLAGQPLRDRRADFTLIDQEETALKYAVEKTYPHVLLSKGQVRVQGMHMSFTDILRGTGALGALPLQDLIYSVGLIDYLADRRATGLVRRLYANLAPGGLLVIGNMNDTPMSNLWPMEFVTDWSLYYRSEMQMIAWTEGLHPAKVWTETERTERVRLLFVQRH
jgi:extracellular factor (EF) 3-hydroxypalmitic acid methyl ester biosynthesis protein